MCFQIVAANREVHLLTDRNWEHSAHLSRLTNPTPVGLTRVGWVSREGFADLIRVGLPGDPGQGALVSARVRSSWLTNPSHSPGDSSVSKNSTRTLRRHLSTRIEPVLSADDLPTRNPRVSSVSECQNKTSRLTNSFLSGRDAPGTATRVRARATNYLLSSGPREEATCLCLLFLL